MDDNIVGKIKSKPVLNMSEIRRQYSTNCKRDFSTRGEEKKNIVLIITVTGIYYHY